ncbi:MAG: GAF domain-containing protein [Gammaproteobacteria bacterium]|nr:GAF domain-containing protein [Gammaproteobacteria bacterium]
MKTFLKVIEIWVPGKDRTCLEFGSGLYGPLADFKAASEKQRFAYDEGLPGKAWAAGHPIVIKSFKHSYFKRTQAAQTAGLTCGIALPVFSGDFLLAVVVFLCGDDEDHAGAIEVWRNRSGEDETLHLMDGYYGSLEQFENISKVLKIPKNEGLPGLVWASGLPVLIENIAEAEGFKRAIDAAQAGITTGLAIPAASGNAQSYVMIFLSAKATPISKRIQIWQPNGDRLVCTTGYSKHNNDLAEIFETVTVQKGIGALGRVWLTGMPSITGAAENESYNPELNDLSSMLAIPVIDQGKLKAIVTFLF